LTWYPTNFSGFYVNGESYYKLTGIAIHYKDVSLRWANKKCWAKIDHHLLSGWFLTKLCIKTWYLFMDCVTFYSIEVRQCRHSDIILLFTT